jgi:hypothetical protein
VNGPRLRWRDAVPIGVAGLFIAYGLYLLAIGPLETIVTPGSGSSTIHEPSSVGLLPVVVGGLVVYGILAGRDRVAWAGGIVAMLLGVAFLFSLAGVLIPMAMLLLAALAVRRLVARRAPHRPARRPTSTGSG